MKTQFSLIFMCLFGASFALYPAVRLTKTRTSLRKPSTEYGVPEPEVRLLISRPRKPNTEYGLPATTYGVPSKSADVDIGEIIEPRAVPKVPSQTYGVPSLPAPEPILAYLIPVKRTFDFDDDDDDDDADDKEVVVMKPSNTYGVPQQRFRIPSTSYGVPDENIPVQREFRSFAKSYETPEVRTPAVVYGVPQIPKEEYGVPQVRVPATVYGL